MTLLLLSRYFLSFVDFGRDTFMGGGAHKIAYKIACMQIEFTRRRACFPFHNHMTNGYENSERVQRAITIHLLTYV